MLKQIDKDKNIYSIEQKDFVCLRALRAFFILLIVFFHIGSSFGKIGAETLKMKYVYEYGGVLGNIFFFMSSGFLVCMVYKKKIIQGGLTFFEFFWGRLKKILPIYYFTNLILIVYLYYINGPSGTSVDRIFRTVFLIQSGWKQADFPYNGVGWFINILFLLYIIFFFICYISKCIGCESAFVYLNIVWCVIGYCIHDSGCTLPFLSWQNSQGYITFSLGVLIYELWSFLKKKRIEKVYAYKSLVFLIIFVIITVIMNRYIGVEEFYGDYKLILMFVIMPQIVFISVSIPLLEKISKPFEPIGKISTQLCFYHLPLLYWFNLCNFKWSSGVRLSIYFVALFLICIIDYTYVKNHKGKRYVEKK